MLRTRDDFLLDQIVQEGVGSRRDRTPGRDQAWPKAWPTSLETVSAAASESAADIASSKIARSWLTMEDAAQAVATPRLARTWDAFLPSRRSAVPSFCLRA